MSIEATTPAEEKLLPEVSENQVRQFADSHLKGTARDILTEERKQKTKQVEKAVAIWYTTTKGWIEQICTTTRAMIERIKSEPDGILAGILPLDELNNFESEFSDASVRLNDVHPLIGRRLLDPLAVMDEDLQDDDQ